MLGGINNGAFFSSFAGFFVVLLLILLLRWTFSRGKSLIERPKRVGNEKEYGLLVPVSKPASHIEGEMLRLKLLEHGIKASVSQTLDGARIFVFPKDQKRAEEILASG
ncbi:MAG: hypothetical protein F2664_05220 [Actinobacteria bacterium]|uniref:Unannotated protein n=1 Tax=freshwater metagenome TaxID=449393 RepID=A0A6J6P1D5_9ZZZZ|nr:hypothetical protein [Actinomycetota bacterium]MSY88460.1 hypothetical protein [Actinomycetota bacterium]